MPLTLDWRCDPTTFASIAALLLLANLALADVTVDDEGRVTMQRPRVWRTIGTEDFLLHVNRSFGDWLTEQEIAHKSTEVSGGHTWSAFRRAVGATRRRCFTTFDPLG